METTSIISGPTSGPSPQSTHHSDAVASVTTELSGGSSEQTYPEESIAEDDGSFGEQSTYIPVSYNFNHSGPFKNIFATPRYRSQRRSRFTRRSLLHRQFSLGRGNPSMVWCNDKGCDDEWLLFTNPQLYLRDCDKSQEGLSLDTYVDDFAELMVSKLFAIQEARAIKHKIRCLVSFIDSPVVRSAFCRFIIHHDYLKVDRSDEEFQKSLVAAQPIFEDLMFGYKTSARIQKVHSYISLDLKNPKDMSPQKLIVRFLVSCEIWRQQKTPRSESWKIGSTRGVSQFLAAILFNYRLMWRQRCFAIGYIKTNDIWNQVWEQWLQKYPLQDLDELVDGDFFQQRNQLKKTEEEVLNEVGYLGGVGQCNETYNPVKWRLGKEDFELMK
ncbi:hypothetical protein BKA59DRAFT_519266 [Fusarium tricinctum]|uniref:Uncharacterized protein n=1 Tax=Fusarium tricinctum TaxID=61284 RepID=A0A8K0S7W0_9HYPO|nr:hypothetical protein BKA59DRAFT_519266 [Fusarium tricinctum]